MGGSLTKQLTSIPSLWPWWPPAYQGPPFIRSSVKFSPPLSQSPLSSSPTLPHIHLSLLHIRPPPNLSLEDFPSLFIAFFPEHTQLTTVYPRWRYLPTKWSLAACLSAPESTTIPHFIFLERHFFQPRSPVSQKPGIVWKRARGVVPMTDSPLERNIWTEAAHSPRVEEIMTLQVSHDHLHAHGSGEP